MDKTQKTRIQRYRRRTPAYIQRHRPKKQTYDPLTDLSNTFLYNEPPEEPPGLLDTPPRREYLIYPRADWDARPPLEGIPEVTLPATQVVYTAEYDGYTPACKNKEDCIKSLKLLQSVYMDQKNQPDIPYNFILGGDGNFYEGRGWTKKPEKSKMYEEYEENTIDIGMITHFVNEPLNKRRELELDLFNILIQFIQDHVDDKYISTEMNMTGFTGKMKY